MSFTVPASGAVLTTSRFAYSAYTGYIDIEARHLFFYFFESRNDPDKDDVVFWTNGGPGGSSAMGLFMELGPCRILDEKGPTFHPESWNSNANIFFIDQPVGVGFSYAEYGEFVVSYFRRMKESSRPDSCLRVQQRKLPKILPHLLLSSSRTFPSSKDVASISQANRTV